MSAIAPISQAQMLAEDIGSFSHDPLAFVRYNFPWGEDRLEDNDGPREWQERILAAVRDHLQNPATRHQPLQIAVASGKGIGKSTLVAWLTNWGLSTCEDTKIVITANTKNQLETKSQPELAKWFPLGLNREWFDVQVQSVKAVQAEHDRTWRADLIPWSLHNTEAFAGLHNKGKRIILIFDEASAIHDRIWEVAEGALTDEDTEILWFAFGNPTRNTGRFRECFGKYKHRWQTFQIDSRTVPGTNKQQIAKWIEDYGEDSDHVRIMVRGEFPRAGFNQFIASDTVEASRKYMAEGYENLPKILSIDVARFGDDQTVGGTRQGRKVEILQKIRSMDVVQVANKVIEWIGKEQPDATVVDADGIGAGVVDYVRSCGYDVFEFHGGHAAFDPVRYFNRRAEVWGALRDALTGPLDIPDDPELATDLISPEYHYSNKQQIILESKDDMKSRGLNSPDCGDMLAMSFAVTPTSRKKVIIDPPHISAWERSGDGSWMG